MHQRGCAGGHCYRLDRSPWFELTYQTYRSYFFSLRLVQCVCTIRYGKSLHNNSHHKQIINTNPFGRNEVRVSLATMVVVDHPSRKRGRRYYYYSCLSRSTGFVRNGFNLGGKCLGVLHVDNYPLFLKLCIIIIHSLTHSHISFTCVLFSFRCYSFAGNFGWLFAAASNVVLLLFHYSTHLILYTWISSIPPPLLYTERKKKRKINHGNY